MAGVDNQLANTRIAMAAKTIASRFELAKLGYYKRNPLERRAYQVVRGVYGEESGLLSTVLLGTKPVLFSPGELMNIYQHARLQAGHGGAYAEVGVFRGASAKVICEAKGAATLHLFDTFEGLPDEAGSMDGNFRKGMYTANEEKVRRRLAGYANVSIHRGIFPDTAGPVRDLRFSFVHLDVDLYAVTKKALEFFYPRMLPGGRILSHDYGPCEGVWLAFDEFMRDKPEPLLPMETSQVALIKA